MVQNFNYKQRKMNIYIVGYMYSGKSTYGRQLAAARDMDFIDLDQAFEARFHYTVRDFFSRFGEVAFRKLETQLLHSTALIDSTIIATGGGTPCHSGNMDFILQTGVAVYLRMTAEELTQRALRSRNPRPLMRGLDDEEVRQKIMHHLSEREPHYLRAQVILNGLQPSLQWSLDRPSPLQ